MTVAPRVSIVSPLRAGTAFRSEMMSSLGSGLGSSLGTGLVSGAGSRLISILGSTFGSSVRAFATNSRSWSISTGTGSSRADDDARADLGGLPQKLRKFVRQADAAVRRRIAGQGAFVQRGS